MSQSKWTTYIGLVLAVAGVVLAKLSAAGIGGHLVTVLGAIVAALGPALTGKEAVGLILLAGFGASSEACQNGNVPPSVVPSINLAVCIFDQYASDPPCRPNGNWLQCVGSIANACGVDAVAVENVLAAQHRAMVADGYVLPPKGDQ